MSDLRQRLLDNIKMYAEAFLLDAAEFYPFGTLIKASGETVPLAGDIEAENDMPPSNDVLSVLQNYLESNVDYVIAAIGVDILLGLNNQKYDALQIRVFEAGKQIEDLRFIYVINKDNVSFTEV
ncbi:hypothetical protein IDJ77_21935 [Mucilaginibacter sp. ZT4R22]|uniref:Uncharacterized protein n=1 Tax=Mucilaginibacter pankratovii TaxID=2772110 RepID=A0ABR7WW26_9SPHI|nr:hypothetical protein [Mucilaginibacter pankratovii]MBD1366490.1 hypothetical protein [Mucilaginibacter pankratovii]